MCAVNPIGNPDMIPLGREEMRAKGNTPLAPPRPLENKTGTGTKAREQTRVYRIGRRPLELSIVSDAVYKVNHNTPRSRFRGEHQQFIGSDGNNFGMQKGGTLFDDTPNLGRYAYDIPEYGQTCYNAAIIDQAREELEQEWEKRKQLIRTTPTRGRVACPDDLDSLRYGLIPYNCQDYVGSVLERAERIAQRKGAKLIVE